MSAAPLGDAPCAPERIAGLDAWRAALMLGGPLVHGSLWLPPRPLFDAIGLCSSVFRMGVFFAVSGYLAACSIDRRGVREWLSGRLVTLGVPLAFAWALLSPFCWWLAQHRGAAQASAALPFDWYHLWFLVALLLYSAVGAWWAAGRAPRWAVRATAASRAELDRGGWPALRRLLIGTAVASAALSAAVIVVVPAVAPSAWMAPLNTAPLTVSYLPMFALGYATARVPELREVLAAHAGRAAGLLVLVGAAYLGLCAFGSAGGRRWMEVLGGYLCPPFAFALVLRSALNGQRVSPVVRALSDASFTVYLLHLPLALALTVLLAPLDMEPVSEFCLIAPGAGLLSYLVHRLGVRRSPLLALLLNGRLPGRARRLAPA